MFNRRFSTTDFFIKEFLPGFFTKDILLGFFAKIFYQHFQNLKNGKKEIQEKFLDRSNIFFEHQILDDKY